MDDSAAPSEQESKAVELPSPREPSEAVPIIEEEAQPEAEAPQEPAPVEEEKEEPPSDSEEM